MAEFASQTIQTTYRKQAGRSAPIDGKRLITDGRGGRSGWSANDDMRAVWGGRLGANNGWLQKGAIRLLVRCVFPRRIFPQMKVTSCFRTYKTTFLHKMHTM
jgi:hypothetical protein